MTRAIRQISTLALILIVFCIACRLTLFQNYSAYIPIQENTDRRGPDGYELVVEQPDILDADGAEINKGYLRVEIRPERPGRTYVMLYDKDGTFVNLAPLYVGRFHTVYNASTGGFTVDVAVMIALTVFWLTVFMIMLWNYAQAKGSSFYAYSTIYFAGFSVFALVTGVLMLQITVLHLRDPYNYSMMTVYHVINSASIQFMMITMPLIVVFALAMGVSNIVLLRHEKPRIQNALGILIAAMLLAGEAIGFYLFTQDFSGSEWEVRTRETLINVAAPVFVYFECMLAGSVVCGIKAAVHQPKKDKDYVIILGCWFRKDGSLPPLLRGRVDKALEFWNEQKAETGKEAVFIPSGGQGKNESMTEADAMKHYLLEQGIPEERIIPERAARNTFQNMEYSKQIIDRENARARTIFATTNYHVFRSGVWSNFAGLHAEGIGGKTKWWYWPNAFMRECVGLLQKRWKQELAFLVILLLFFGSLSVILG